MKESIVYFRGLAKTSDYLEKVNKYKNKQSVQCVTKKKKRQKKVQDDKEIILNT